ncbi:zinc ribbon domain-containing protein [Streptosporangiaceae bacterium NEAU-GS5]|nr:zinc ribbon domain-containing protein [Streptosporangiaceae bacterium NEAU-GS5]
MSVTCRVCGQVNSDGTQFCVNPSCGAYLPWDRTAGHQRPPAPPPPQQPPAPRPQPPRQAPPPPEASRTAQQPRVEDQRTGARIELAQSALSVEPGQVTDTQATIHNTGTRVERFTVRVSGPAARWATVEPADVTVYPGQPGVCMVKFAPPRQAANTAGAWNFGVLADSQVTPGLQASAVGSVQLGGFRALTLSLEPGSGPRQILYVDNQGNMPEQVSLAGADSEGLLRFEIPPGVTVNPGRSAVPFRVRARRDWFGKPKRVPYRVTSTPSDGQPLTADGVRVLKPLLGVLPLVLAGVLAVAAAGGVALKMRSSGDSSGSGGTVTAATRSSEPEQTSEKTPTSEPTTEEPSPEPTPEETTEPPPPPPSPDPPTTTPPPPVDPATQLLIEYRREGGLAGWLDRITVFGDGRATVDRGQGANDKHLTDSELSDLKDKLANLPIGQSEEDPQIRDEVTYVMTVNGRQWTQYDGLDGGWDEVAEILEGVIERP